MLCRALLAAAVLSYVLCVLLLSGVQKEDIDAGTLRKLQRHNVNIDDINDRQLQERCLGKTNVPINLTTPQTSPTTEKTTTGKTVTAKDIPNETYKDVGSLAAESTPLQKIVEYLQYKQKEERRKALESKHNIKKSTLGLGLLTTLPSRSSSQDQPGEIKIEDASTERAQKAVSNNDDEKTNKVYINKELEKLMEIWQTNLNRMSDSTKQESTTIKIIKDNLMSKNTKDVEYITKIVAEIMSKRQFNDATTSTIAPKRNFNTNETFRSIEKTSAAQFYNETFLPATYFLNKCNLGNFYANKAVGKDKNDVLEKLYKHLNYDVNSQVTNAKADDEYVICKRFESKHKDILETNWIDDNTVNYILSKIKKERQGINVLDSKNAKFGISLESQPKSAVFKQQSDRVKTIYTYDENHNHLDNDSARALQAALENQSQSLLFDRPNERMKISDTHKERLNLLEDESAKVFETGLNDQPKIQHVDHQSDRIKGTRENENNYPRFVDENKNLWPKYFESLRNTQETKIQDEPAQTVPKPPNHRYKALNQDDSALQEEYKRWLLKYHNPSNKPQLSMKMQKNRLLNNRAVDHEQPTNVQNSIEYNPNLSNQYKRPWLYGGMSNEQFRAYIKGKQNQVLFKPKDQERITNTIDPRLENVYKDIWPPYFEALNNDTSIIRTEENETPKNNQEPILFDLDRPALIQPNNRDISPKRMDVSKNNPNFVGWYPKKSQNIIEDRSDKQFEPNRDQKTNRAASQTVHQNQIDARPDAEYKSNWAYFRNKQSKKRKPNMEEENDDETEYFINSKSTKQNDYQYPPRPYVAKLTKPPGDTDTTINRYGTYTNKDKLSNRNGKKDDTKFPTLPPNVIKDIANSVKEIVLRDLKTTTTIPTTTKLTTTTPSTTITPATTTTTSTTTTTTKPTTTTTHTTTTTTTTTSTKKSTTTEGTSITTKDPLKIQDASKALEKIMEIFEKISSIKDKMVKLDVKNTKDVHYEATTIATTLTNEIVQKLDQPVQFKQENRVQYAPQSQQFKTENQVPYDLHTVQLKAENGILYDPVQFKAENRILYEPQSMQLKLENRLPNDPHAVRFQLENRIPFDPQAVQHKAENRMPYNQQAVQLQVENRIPYNPQPLLLKTENQLPYDPQLVQRKPENRIPYDYSAKSPYYHSKIEYDPYLDKEVLEPVTRKTKTKKAPRTYAITVQTNSGEIAPLKIAVKKPLVQNIVLTTKAPIKEENISDETFNYRKPITSANRHQVDHIRENEANHVREKKPFISRHTHRDTYSDIPKSRRIKKEREFTEEYKPRDMQAIERFHEKLERVESWPRYEEEKIAQRVQRPLVKKTSYDDTHFRNFLQTQQKVNAMLEKILGSGKTKSVSAEAI